MPLDIISQDRHSIIYKVKKPNNNICIYREETSDNTTLRDNLEHGRLVFSNVINDMKNKEELKISFWWKENKETWHLNVTHGSRLDSELGENNSYKIVGKSIIVEYNL